MLGICIGILVLIVVGWAIIKGKYAPLILFASGIFMLAQSRLADYVDGGLCLLHDAHRCQ